MGLPQREGRPALDIAPGGFDQLGGSWDETFTAGNPLNEPVPVRKGSAAVNGWTIEPHAVYPTGEDPENNVVPPNQHPTRSK